MNKEQVNGILRTGIAYGAGVVATKYSIPEHLVVEIASGLAAVLVGVWSVLAKQK